MVNGAMLDFSALTALCGQDKYAYQDFLQLKFASVMNFIGCSGKPLSLPLYQCKDNI